MSKLSEWVELARAIPELQIDHAAVHTDFQRVKEFSADMLKPLTGAYLEQNRIVLPVWDDQAMVGNLMFPWGYHKYVDYEVNRFGLGLVNVTMIYGKRSRKSSDFRFRSDIDTVNTDFHFMYDFDKGHYVELDPNQDREKNKKAAEWHHRLQELADIEQKAAAFIFDFLVDLEKQIGRIRNFTLDNQKSYREVISFLKFVNAFIEESTMYMSLLLVLYGDLDSGEYTAIIWAIEEQKRMNKKAVEHCQLFSDDSSYDVLLDYHDRGKEHMPFGPVGNAVQAIKQLVTPRKEKINDDDWFIYNKRQGYLKSREGKLYPNIGEIERRRGLYKEAANEQSERQLINELYKRATEK